MNTQLATANRVERNTPVKVERWLLALLTIVLACTVYLRFHNLGKPCWYDEYDSRMHIAGFTGLELVNHFKTCAYPIPVEKLRPFIHWRWQTGETFPLWSILQSDFQVSPLYYWTARLWVLLFGDTISVLRIYSVVSGLVSLALVYILCRELFREQRTACITTCLIASSPVFLIYSQEIRHYGWWIVTVLLANIALLRAVRRSDRSSWAVYATALAASFLVNPLSLLVAASHGMFMVTPHKLGGDKTRPFRDSLKAYFGALSVASLVLVPRIFLRSFDAFTGHGLDWLGVPPKAGLPEYAWSATVRNCSRLFWDSVGWDTWSGDWLVAAGLAGLVGIAIIYINMKGSPGQKWFVNSILIGSVVVLMLRDLVLLGRSATITRYLFPALIAGELAVGYLFAAQTISIRGGDKPCPFESGSRSKLRQALWITGLFAVIALGWHGCFRVANDNVHWGNWPEINAGVTAVASEINQATKPVVLIPFHSSSRMPLVLVERLNAGSGIIPCSSTSGRWQSAMMCELRSGRPVFAWDPRSEILDELRSRHDVALSSIGAEKQAWRLMLSPKFTCGLIPKI